MVCDDTKQVVVADNINGKIRILSVKDLSEVRSIESDFLSSIFIEDKVLLYQQSDSSGTGKCPVSFKRFNLKENKPMDAITIKSKCSENTNIFKHEDLIAWSSDKHLSFGNCSDMVPIIKYKIKAD